MARIPERVRDLLIASSLILAGGAALVLDAWLVDALRPARARIAPTLMLGLFWYCVAYPAAIYWAGWAMAERRNWGRTLFLAAVPLGIASGFALFGMRVMKNPVILFAHALILPAWFAAVIGKRMETSDSDASEPRTQERAAAAGSVLGWLVTVAAVAFLFTAIAFSTLASGASLVVAAIVGVGLSVLLVMCRWNTPARVVSIITLGTATCLLAFLGPVLLADWSRLPPLAALPVLAPSGLIWRASWGITLDGLIESLLRASIFGAAALLLVGPAAAFGLRNLGMGSGRLSLAAKPLLAFALVLSLAIPLAIHVVSPPIEIPSRESQPVATEKVPAVATPPAPVRSPREGEMVTGGIEGGSPAGVLGGELPAGAVEEGPPAGVAIPPSVRREVRPLASLPERIPVERLKLTHMVPPVFPESARRAGRGGTVVLELHIDRTGKVTKATVKHGDAEFAEAALESATRRRYMPHVIGGEFREVVTELVMHFKPGKGVGEKFQ